MPYKETKIYSDGSHYIAIPKTGKIGKKGKVKRYAGQNKEFDTIYESFAGMSKKEKIKKVKETLAKTIPDKESLNQFVKDNMERRTKNRIVRWTRLMRKIHLQEWNYFCTFTYDDKLHTEESFKKRFLIVSVTYRRGKVGNISVCGNDRRRKSGCTFTGYSIFRK